MQHCSFFSTIKVINIRYHLNLIPHQFPHLVSCAFVRMVQKREISQFQVALLDITIRITYYHPSEDLEDNKTFYE